MLVDRPRLRASAGFSRLVIALVVLAVAPLASQPPPPAADSIEAARQLRDRGELERAAAMLRRHLAAHPDDVDARWLLAQTLYWQGELEPARAEYERALAGRPGDTLLRLDVARFLVEIGRGQAATRVLAPLRATRGALPPDLRAELARLEIEAARQSAPWVRLGAEAWDDDQPLQGARAELAAGWFPASGVRVALQAAGARLTAGSVEAEVAEYEALLAVRRPGSRLEAELAGGISARGAGGAQESIGRLTLGLHLPGETRLRAEGRRWRYLWTVNSLNADLMVDTVEASFGRPAAPDWAGEVGARRDSFPDDNEITSAWAWVLAPVVHRPRGSLRLGYAWQQQDAEETRFTAAGVYDPYYTPEQVVAHSAVVAVALTPEPRWSFYLDGAYAFHARQQAPRRDPLAGIVFEERELTPWRARLRAQGELSPRLAIQLGAEHERAAFFEITRASAGITVRFPR
jgi:hypothetical protein